MNGFFTNGKFDSSKFRSVYNLLNFEGDVKKPGTDEFGTAVMLLLDKYTRIYKDHKYTQSMESVMLQIRKIIIRFKSTIDHYAACVKYYCLILLDRKLDIHSILSFLINTNIILYFNFSNCFEGELKWEIFSCTLHFSLLKIYPNNIIY